MSGATVGGTAVCVLGMSRTGTSLTTRVLDLAGVYLGPMDELLGTELRQLAGEGEDVLAKARSSNPEGHWEHYRLMRLNERILRALGGSWREPPEMPPGWESSPELAAERDEARALLFESFAGHELWGWKDPRSSLTLPFWQCLIAEMRYVICLRNPLDIAASLERREGMSVAQALALWRVYVAAALAQTAGRPRLLVRYEDFFADRVGTAQRLARFVGCGRAFDDWEGQRRLAETVDERLWRNRSDAR
jgi:O-antigen biosynthesis protein